MAWLRRFPTPGLVVLSPRFPGILTGFQRGVSFGGYSKDQHLAMGKTKVGEFATLDAPTHKQGRVQFSFVPSYNLLNFSPLPSVQPRNLVFSAGLRRPLSSVAQSSTDQCVKWKIAARIVSVGLLSPSNVILYS